MIGKAKYPMEFKIDNKIINSEENVKLLGLEIDRKLNFNKYI